MGCCHSDAEKPVNFDDLPNMMADADKEGQALLNKQLAPERNGSQTSKVQRKERTAKRTIQTALPSAKDTSPFARADPQKWIFKEMLFSGSYSMTTLGQKDEIKGPIAEGIHKLKAEPSKYIAMWFQADMVNPQASQPWPVDQQSYVLLHREGTDGYKPAEAANGAFKCIMATYQPLKPMQLGGQDKDHHTDKLGYHGVLCAPGVCPGRGQGVGDVPGLKIIGDINPSDVSQGGVGDCWLLSGISSLAEFDGAVARLFRKNNDLTKKPYSDRANMYTITLWDVSTWKEVDIVIDERLCQRPDGSGLLGCHLSDDGELWVPYLEKALAVHCGGWDKIDGGQCTHAWALLTGCQNQYTIKQKDNKFNCFGTFNPNKKEWEKLTNSPHDGFQGLWPVAWPDVGGGGDMNLELTEQELFQRMCAWDDHNFIVGAGTKAGSDSNSKNGIYDGHAYSVLTCLNDVAGTDMDLIQMRNPHGKGEIEKSEWNDTGSGWQKYPQIKAALKPVVADDGIFWVSKQEFFKYFETVYVCAKDMTQFLQD